MIQAQPNREWRYGGLFLLHLANPPFSEHTKLIIFFPSVPYKWRNLDLAINMLRTCNEFVCIIHCEFHHKDAKVIWNTFNRRFVDLPLVMIQVQMITSFWDFLYQPTHVKFRFGILIWKSLSDDVIPASFRPRIDVYTGDTRSFVNGALNWINMAKNILFGSLIRLVNYLAK